MALKKLLTDLSTGLNAYPNHNTPSTSGGFNYGNSHTPIFDGQFKQKSFEFGKGRTSDRPGGGFSNEPYLYSGKLSADQLPDVPNPGDESLLNKLGSGVDSATDGLVRGGLITAIKRSGQDLLRIGKWAFDWPTGPMWLLTQMGLQRSNPKIQEGSTKIDIDLGKLGGIDIDLGGNSRTYNPLGLNTLAQTLTSFTGFHINRAGLLPLGPSNYRSEIGYNYVPNDKKYETMVKELADEHMAGDYKTGYYQSNRMLHLHFFNTDEASKEEDAIPNNIIAEYSGGPHSLYGIGKTTLLRYEHTTGPDSKYRRLVALGVGKPSYEAGIGGFESPFKPYTITKEEGGALFKKRDKLTELDKEGHRVIYKNTDFDVSGNYTTKDGSVTDFRKYANRGYTNYQKETSNGKKFNREQRVNLGSPGKQITRGIDKETGEMIYNVYSPETVDKINALDIIRTKGDFVDQRFRDLVRFRIEAVDSDRPEEADTMLFRAFLDSFSDAYSANHNNFKYNGRGEEFYTYNSFKRKITFSFKIAAQSRWEMMPLYRKLNFLVSNVSPEYKVTRMRTPFIRLTIGSMIDRTPGILNSVNLKWQKNYPWEIAIDSPEGGQDKEMVVLPHVLDVNVSFTPIHNFLPQKSITRSPYIMPHHNNRVLNPEQKWYTAGAAGSEYDKDSKTFKSKGTIEEALNEASIDGLRKRTLGDESLKLPNYDEILKTPETGNKEYVKKEQEQESTGTGEATGTGTGTNDETGGGTAVNSNASSTGDASTTGAGASATGTTGGSGDETQTSGDKKSSADDAVRKSSKTGGGVNNTLPQKGPEEGAKETKHLNDHEPIPDGTASGDKAFQSNVTPGDLGGDRCKVDHFFYQNEVTKKWFIVHGIKIDGKGIDSIWEDISWEKYGLRGMKDESEAKSRETVLRAMRWRKNAPEGGPIFFEGKVTKDSKITSATYAEIHGWNYEEPEEY
tara:strand:+ start:5456 stop:8329 length:2874 start_codon:yes stop_codon:yes gene_type:complete